MRRQRSKLQPPSKSKKHRRRVTIQGRVVYDRQKHYFSEKDIARITRVLLQNAMKEHPHDPEPMPTLADLLLRILKELFQVMLEILDLSIAWRVVLKYLEYLIQWIFDDAPLEIKAELTKYLGVQFRVTK